MKYGLVYYKNSTNIGDAIQTYAIYCLYKEIGISEKDIIKMELEELREYSGEYVILPMNTFSHTETLHLSERIIPLYIGYNNTLYLNKKDIRYLKNYEPIGCRDEYTMRNMRSYGIQSFITGCYTLTLPKRSNRHNHDKIFLVDVPDKLINYIPDNIKNKIVRTSHIISDRTNDSFNTSEKFYNFAIKRLETYANDAALVVTGRLHCASPCLALGIPVIIVKQNIDINLSWIDKFLPVYTEDEFENINWYPGVIDVENHKNKMKSLFADRLFNISKQYQEFSDISYFYEIREKCNYNSKLKKRLTSIIKNIEKQDFSYCIWGCGPGGMLAHNLIQEACPTACLTAGIDKYKAGDFFGVPILAPEQVSAISADIVFICTYAGRIDAVTILEKINKVKKQKYTFLLSKDNCQDEYFPGYDELYERE